MSPLALPVGPEGRDQMAMAAWPRAGGRWEAYEQFVTREIVRAAWLSESAAFWPPDATDELLVYDLGASWARVRVTVEVLDGIL